VEIVPGILSWNKNMRRGTWFWCDDDGSWVPYEEPIAEKLEMEVLRYREFTVVISEQPTRIVIGNDGHFKQLRKSQNAKPEGRDVQRGKNGKFF